MKSFFTHCLLLFLFSCSEKEKDKAVIMKTLTDYPSASAVEYLDSKLYVMGDDATQLMVLDTNFNAVDSILLFNYPDRRIPKNIKHDIESMMLSDDGRKLILIGSGSLSPFRDTVVLINLNDKSIERKSISDFYTLAKTKGLKEINIEGATLRNSGFILMANRGHLGWPKNYFLFSTRLEADSINMDIDSVDINNDSSFNGISGLAYSNRNDALVITASTEQTSSVFEDGTIGKSYIWIIKKLHSVNKFKPDIIFDLETIDPIFKGQKIESVTILNETKDMLRLVLVADNDNGSSTIFKLSIKIN
jgi:hypothetical protein